jgi:hypothetical protein
VGIHRLLHSSCCLLNTTTAITRQLIGTARTLEAEWWQVWGEAWVRGQRKMSQVLGAFGLLDFAMLRPVLAWRAFWKAIALQLVTKFRNFYETRSFVTVFPTAHHLSLSRILSTQSTPFHLIYWKLILILSSHLHLEFQVVSFLHASPDKHFMHLFSSPYLPHAPSSHSSLFDHGAISGEEGSSWSSLRWNLNQISIAIKVIRWISERETGSRLYDGKFHRLDTVKIRTNNESQECKK